ncbi:MAG: amidohydrolase family protein, partial [Parvularculaceae bacterium]
MLKRTILSIIAVSAVIISGCSKKVESAENAELSGGQKAVSVASAALFTEGKSKSGGPDLVLRGTIYTGDPDLPIAGEISIEDGKISAILPPGKTGKAGKRTILLERATAFPGFTDAHAHLTGIGFREMTLNLEDTSSIADLVAKVTAAAANLQRGEVLYGRGWIETGWPEGRFPNAQDLDQISTKNAILLERADGHAMVVNTLALSHANIKADTANPDGGKIERDSAGKATGMLIDNAMSLVTVLMQSPSEAQRLEAIKKGAEVYAKYGWTGMHNMSVEAGDADLMVQLEERGELPIRVYNALVPEALDDLIARKIWSVN